jgi:hypothetical protein
MKTEFTSADQNGRDLFKHYCSHQSWCTVVKEATDDYSHWDIAYTSGSTMCIGEIKTRTYDSTAFGDWDYEEKKHNALLEVHKKIKTKYPDKKVEIQYINIYKDEAVKIWTTTNIANEQQPIVQYRPATTLGNNTEITKKIYKCYSTKEANKGMLNQMILVRPDTDEDEDDGLPF